MDAIETCRRSTRHAVNMRCALQSDLWDEPVALRATEISRSGVWVETDFLLEPGEQVVLSLDLAQGEPGEQLWALARVSRVGAYRRRGEAKRSGMGLAIWYVRPEDAARLESALGEGLKP